ncbi:peroxidase 29-like [Rhododendron vialii]|uniref:peroxidase 29-like n=1 Tax=Rhododendron vialii TaxID=182163 RepID=UPI00265EE245|nr:peroxidase 29-like [Rhododendron vialii]
MGFSRTMFGVIFVFALWFEVLEGGGGGGGLSYDFYEGTCPQVEDIVRAGLKSVSLTDPTTPSAMLRLMFHDCQVQGCDASILIDTVTMPSEMDSTKNFGIRKRETITLLKSMVEVVCPHRVSCADILILAARDAVAMSGGPWIQVPLGRRDSISFPSYSLADSLLPAAGLGVDGMLRIFGSKGMSIEESVAIMGSHTLGVSHCFNIFTRLQAPQQGKAEYIEPGLETLLKLSCPLGSLTPNSSFVVNDPTSLTFDNQYYLNAMRGRGILRVDAELPSDLRTGPFVRNFGENQEDFFRAFSSGFVKLASSGVLTGDQGVIRGICSVI